MEGETLLNGHPKVQATFSRVMGYVEQFDLHIPQVGEQACWRRGDDGSRPGGWGERGGGCRGRD